MEQEDWETWLTSAGYYGTASAFYQGPAVYQVLSWVLYTHYYYFGNFMIK